MNIHEYQAKRLLHEYGAPVAAGVAIYSAEQAEEWAKKLPGPLYVVKSQIHAPTAAPRASRKIGAIQRRILLLVDWVGLA